LIRFNFVVVLAVEITAIAELFNFKFDPKYLAEVQYPEPSLEWGFGQQTNPAVWVFLFLVFTLLINLLPVRVFGEIEYVFGSCKLIFIVGLILFNVIINARRGDTFEYYNEPYSFESRNFTTASHVFTGGPGHLASVWTAMTAAIFSLTGFESVAISAPENRDLAKDESIKLATRKTSLRVILLYSLAVFTVGLNIPYTDSNLRDYSINAIKSGEHSVFIIAAVRNHVLRWPKFFNGFYIFSATSCGLSTLYVASRVLHALASVPDVWPNWTVARNVKSMLERTVWGVPMAAVLVSWLFGLLGFLVVSSDPNVVILLAQYPQDLGI
jgi:amino acid transporter